MTLSDLIQTAAVLAAVGTSIVALVIADRDRKNATKIAEEDRRHAVDQVLLLAELEAAKRLAIIEARGGHADPVIASDMAAESLALIALLGSDRVPHMWGRRVEKSDAELRAFIEDETNAEFLRDAVEAERAVHDILGELRSLRTAKQ